MDKSEIQKQLAALESIAAGTDIDIQADMDRIRKKLADQENQVVEQVPEAWKRVELARHKNRPTTLDYIEEIFDDFIELHGDRNFRDDPAVVGGIALLGDMPVTVVGHQKGRNVKENIKRNFGMAHPEGYRKSLRLMKQAEKFGRPIVTFIDTPGAYCGLGAEERGQGEAIATNLFEMADLSVPVISIVIGEGGSGGALAFGIGDRVYMLENTIYSILSPEGFASILWKDATKAKVASDIMKITAADLHGFGIVDGIIPETHPAHESLEMVSKEIKSAISKDLESLHALNLEERLEQRYNKFRNMGQYTE